MLMILKIVKTTFVNAITLFFFLEKKPLISKQITINYDVDHHPPLIIKRVL